jgi:hypothetical protein
MRVSKYSQIPQLMTGKLITPALPVFSTPVVAVKRGLDFSIVNTVTSGSGFGSGSGSGFGSGRSILNSGNANGGGNYDLRKINCYM